MIQHEGYKSENMPFNIIYTPPCSRNFSSLNGDSYHSSMTQCVQAQYRLQHDLTKNFKSRFISMSGTANVTKEVEKSLPGTCHVSLTSPLSYNTFTVRFANLLYS